ncbi:MAG TPA: hypothetical protein VFF52_17285 [Isosphaeraceae bacterium]|nr:hypothetical protein [Isosphaeraceae bacterium]
MARKKTPTDNFRERLDGLSKAITDDLRLPSLEENRLEGYAYLFRLVLPLLDAIGKPVFTDPILDELVQVLDNRFGGCMAASSSSAPPLWGLWHPPQESQAAKDYLTTVEVLANPIEAANRFFAGLKPILKTAGQIEQQELLILRIECRLM